MAKIIGTLSGPWDKKDYSTKDLNDQITALNDLNDKSDKLPEHEMKGRIISFPVADGAAHYMVENTKPLHLKFIPVLDAYQADDILIRGLRLSDVEKMVQSRIKLLKMFPKKP